LAEFDVVGVTPFMLDELRPLNPFAVEYRYDDEFESGLSRDEVTELVERVLAWAESCVNFTAAPKT
jgi:hypothetical protein